MKNKTCGDCELLYREEDVCRNTGEDVNRYTLACMHFEPRATTNGDRLRQMNNEELAREFAALTSFGVTCDDCPVNDRCVTEIADCIPAWLDYLDDKARNLTE